MMRNRLVLLTLSSIFMAVGHLGHTFGQIVIPAAQRAVPALRADVKVTNSIYTSTGSVVQTEQGSFWRSGDGRTRQDNAIASIINDPGASTITHLDPVKKVATITLGTNTIEGFQVIGRRFTVPSRSGMNLGTVTIENWHSPDLGLRLVIKQQCIDGELLQTYQNIELGEPPADVFLIPSGYSVQWSAPRRTEAATK